MAGVLELAQLLQHDGVAEVDVWGRRIEAELAAQRLTALTCARELRSERTGRQRVLDVAGEPRGGLEVLVGWHALGIGHRVQW